MTTTTPAKEERSIPRRMWDGVKGATQTTMVAIGTFTVVSVGISAAVAVVRKRRAELPRRFHVSIDVSGQFTEKPSKRLPFQNSMFPGGKRKHDFLALLKHIDRAAADPRVIGILGHTSSGQISLSHAQANELRAAILRFRATKGPTCTSSFYADTLEGSAGLQSIMVAGAFGHVAMQESGLLYLVGQAASAPYLRKMLDKWGIVPHVQRREGYKSALDSFELEHRSEQDREQTGLILDGLVRHAAASVAQDRNMSLEEATQAVVGGPYSSTEAVEKRLVDTVAYRDQWLARTTAHDAADEEARMEKLGAVGALTATAGSVRQGTALMVDVHEYGRKSAAMDKAADKKNQFQVEDLEHLVLNQKINNLYSKLKSSFSSLRTRFNDRHGRPVAVVVCNGVISRGTDLTNGIQSAAVCRELKQIRLNPKIKAVVLRIDSPGGCAVTSDAIYREAMLIREAGKVLVVSMSTVAASGGYYIASASRHIFALPSTITGSIGVIFGKSDFSALLNRMGINIDAQKRGELSDSLHVMSPYTEGQEKAWSKILDDIYSLFIKRVAVGRGMDEGRVRSLAGGRVYTGEDAKRAGLVDELGGLHEAIAFAKKTAGLANEAGVEYFPRPKSTIELIRDRFDDTDPTATAQIMEIAEAKLGTLVGRARSSAVQATGAEEWHNTNSNNGVRL